MVNNSSSISHFALDEEFTNCDVCTIFLMLDYAICQMPNSLNFSNLNWLFVNVKQSVKLHFNDKNFLTLLNYYFFL